MSEKMKIAAVICELDPPHFGHRWLFDRVKEQAEGLVCILSGNYVQRGAPAVLDKWARAELALKNGADLILELPLPWACARAERFAAGAVASAEALGCVDTLCFGSEETDTEKLEQVARALLSDEFSARLGALGEDGASFAARRQRVIGEMIGEEAAAVLGQPNAILAVEYCKALQSMGSSIRPAAFPRQGYGHGGEGETGFLSGSQLRALLLAEEPLDGLAPEDTLQVLAREREAGRCPVELRYLERAILGKLRGLSLTDFSHLPDLSEGVENRLYTASRSAHDLEELLSLIKTRRYPMARIRRLILHAFLGLDAALFTGPEGTPLPPYLRVLGINDVGEEILGQASFSLPVVTRAADLKELSPAVNRIFALEAAADDLYALACPLPQPCGRDYTEKMLRV